MKDYITCIDCKDTTTEYQAFKTCIRCKDINCLGCISSYHSSEWYCVSCMNEILKKKKNK